MPHGWGYFTLKNGGVIQGNFVDGLPFSHIRKINPNGSYFEGHLENWQETGEGKLTLRDGSYTVCKTWVNAVPHGIYEEYDSHGKLIFKGTKVNGLWQGPCIIHTKDFTIEGNFQAGEAVGNVTKKYDNTSVYVGQVRGADLLEDGLGRLTYIDGRVYEGQFSRGVRNGTGKLTTDDKTKTVDQTWKDGKRV